MQRRTPLVTPVDGWRGIRLADARRAIWCMRAIVAHNILARREEDTLFVPINRSLDPDGSRVASVLADVERLAAIDAAPRLQS